MKSLLKIWFKVGKVIQNISGAALLAMFNNLQDEFLVFYLYMFYTLYEWNSVPLSNVIDINI
jgi:hypothetical protein